MRRGPPAAGRPFPRSSLETDPPQAARSLIGAHLVRRLPDGGERRGRIVEVEAYGGPEDRASHARSGRTARNASMFGPAGRAYVYRVYGIHDCLNVVTGRDGEASAVLLRAAESLHPRGAEPRDPRWASGPGRLARAFAVTRADDGCDLLDPTSELRLELGARDGSGAVPPLDGPSLDMTPSVAAGPRVGVAYAGPPWDAVPWRLADASSPAVSRPRLRALTSGGAD